MSCTIYSVVDERWHNEGSLSPNITFERKIHHFLENEAHVVEITDIRLETYDSSSSPSSFMCVSECDCLRHFLALTKCVCDSCFLICPIEMNSNERKNMDNHFDAPILIFSLFWFNFFIASPHRLAIYLCR